jgi:DNA polymerase/3'-5' exonuclease PolX
VIISQARNIASEWVRLLGPYCERIEIAGGIRRGKEEVHDAEIVAIPKLGKDMFGEEVPGKSMIEDFFYQTQAILKKDGPRYKQIVRPEDGFSLDLFIVLPPAQWGVIFTIRTGPADFSKWIVSKRAQGGALPSFAKVKDGAVIVDGQALPMPEEIDFLDFLELGWIEPRERHCGLQRHFTGGRT